MANDNDDINLIDYLEMLIQNIPPKQGYYYS